MLLTLFSPTISSGNGTAAVKKVKTGLPVRQTGWIRERQILEESLKRIQDKDLQTIAQTFIKTEEPKVKKVVKKIIDYSKNAEKIKTLDLEIKRLEKTLEQKQSTEFLETQKQNDLNNAINLLKAILKEDIEIIDMYLEIEQKETMALLNAIRVIL